MPPAPTPRAPRSEPDARKSLMQATECGGSHSSSAAKAMTKQVARDRPRALMVEYVLFSEYSGAMARVLIVDDLEFMRSLLRDILRRQGHELAGEARNGREALLKYAQVKPDVVLLDI